MTHLAIEEIIEFVSFETLSEKTIAQSAKVNVHIRSCSYCREKVSSFQMVYDELCRIVNIADARRCIYRMVDEGQIKLIQKNELNEEIQSFIDSAMNDMIR